MIEIGDNQDPELGEYPEQLPEFITVTCLEWKPVLVDNRLKNIVTDSLSFLVRNNRAIIYAFAIMENHFHMIWQIIGDHQRKDVQRDFLKFTGQQILKILRYESSAMHDRLIVKAKDRKRQVWERNSLGIPLWSPPIISQKLNYIHNNPVKAGLCEYPYDYEYSSARFYWFGDKQWDFLTRMDM